MNPRFRTGLALAAVTTVVMLAVARYMVHSLTRVVRVRIGDNPSRLGLQYEDVSFHTAGDRLVLRGWYVASARGDRCIVMTHGVAYHRADPTIGMLEIARGLIEHGYDVLMFDLRGHGESDDGRATGGYYERRDVQGAVAYVKARGFLPQRIGLLGFSLGAAASLLAAAEDEEIAAVVVDSCWADLTDLIKSEIAKRPYMPRLLTAIVPSLAKLAYGVNIDEVKPLAAVDKIAPRPIFFIHGEFDEVVPVENALRLYHRDNNENNRLWIVPEAVHAGSYRARPDEYIAKIAEFFNQALK